MDGINAIVKMNETDSYVDISLENRLEIIDEGIRKKYLARLNEMEIAPADNLENLEDDLIENIRLYKINEMVYQKGEPATDKFTTVFNTLSTYNASVIIVMDSDGRKTDFYFGVRNNEKQKELKRSTVTLGDTLKNTLIGHFPGMKICNENRKSISSLVERIVAQKNVAAVSVVGNSKSKDDDPERGFVQGIEKLALAMNGRCYTGVIIAENQSPKTIEELRNGYENLYTKLSEFQNVQTSASYNEGKSKAQSFSEMSPLQKTAMIGSAIISVAGVAAGMAIGGPGTGGMLGGQLGGQIGGQFSNFLNSLAPNPQKSTNESLTKSVSTENKRVTDMLKLIDENIEKLNEFDSYGMWNIAGYFVSDDMSAAEIAASNYRSLMNGENSGREVSAINSWRKNDARIRGDYESLTKYISRFIHPKFIYGSSGEMAVYRDASTSISGKELGLHLGLPRATVPGLPVIEHAEFGKEVYKYQMTSKKELTRPEDRLMLGKVFDLGQVTDKAVELNNKSLNMHTFITGSTGSGKSNTVYQILNELHQDRIPFLVVEPAKGEYKDVFGNWSDVNVYSTNPNIAEMININPFKFPPSIHVLEHIDGLVEIFSVCWPMYDAMPAFFKDAILKSYEVVGWDLGSSNYEGRTPEFPDFEILAEQLNELIEASDYASDIKSNYRGALITRVKSLSVGLNKFIFTSEQTSYEKLFDENCIVDISRVKSTETKALIMGLMVYILNEYRVDKKTENNKGCKHITVIEEAHNLLRNTSGSSSELVGKSVEMLTNTIAEIRTYGEGFIIVDQSPSSVDIAAIKNTNTKIVLRTPEANDREAVGRSMGLTEDQVNEIAKLPSGVAVVYQNDWVKPVLTMIDKANVIESNYVIKNPKPITPLKLARTDIIRVIMQPWIGGSRINSDRLKHSLEVLTISRAEKRKLINLLSDYSIFNGKIIWKEEQIPDLQALLRSVLGLSDKLINDMYSPDDLRKAVFDKTYKLTQDNIQDICYVLTFKKGEA